MSDMLRDLYYGRVNPFGMKLPNDEETLGLITRSTELEHEVVEYLVDTGREKFTEFLKVDGEFGDIQQFTSFCRGFRIGARLMIDALCEDSRIQGRLYIDVLLTKKQRNASTRSLLLC